MITVNGDFVDFVDILTDDQIDRLYNLFIDIDMKDKIDCDYARDIILSLKAWQSGDQNELDRILSYSAHIQPDFSYVTRGPH